MQNLSTEFRCEPIDAASAGVDYDCALTIDCRHAPFYDNCNYGK